jgi:hypothetical protein
MRMRFRKSIFAVVLFFFLLGADLPAQQLQTNSIAPAKSLALMEGFESGRLADFWLSGDYGSGRFEPDRVKLSRKFARAGVYSVELTVREGDVAQPGADNTVTERTELDSGKYPLYSKEVCYGFAFLVPEDFPIRDVRLVISQMKQSDVDGPLIAQRYRDGVHSLTIESHGKKNRYRLPTIRKGQWQDMMFRVRYSEADGRVEVWMNGKRVVNYTGPLGDRSARNFFYHKMGLYRDKMKEPMTIYFDNYRVGPTLEAVDPAKFPSPDRR